MVVHGSSHRYGLSKRYGACIALALTSCTLIWELIQLTNWESSVVGPTDTRITIDTRLLARDQDLDDSQWGFQDHWSGAPGCMVNGDNSTGNCPDLDALFSQCTSEQCTETFLGECFTYDNVTDYHCICEHYTSETCTQSCQGDIQRHRYFVWLNATCAPVGVSTGLPSNWSSVPSPLEVLEVGSIESDYDYWDSSTTYQYSLDTLSCLSQNNTCIPFQFCLAKGSDVWSTDPYGQYENGTLYLDQSCFCTHTFDDFERTCSCGEGLGRTELLTWYNATCHNATEFPNAPSDWAQDLLLFDDNYVHQSSFGWPKCLGKANFTMRSMNEAEGNCTSTRCQLDESGNCTKTALAVDKSCFCNGLRYEEACSESCGLTWERHDALSWMNSTCSSISGWNGLPSNWTDWRHIQENELIPWHWSLQTIDLPGNLTNITSAPNSERHCPSTKAKLGAYAAVNGAIAILVPLLGRRTVVRRLTFGLCGHPWSRMWILTGFISIGLQVGSNVINATYVRSVPGFEKVPVGELTMLWCTRPRMAWLVVALLPLQAKEAMYFSVVSSCLAAEAILQLLGSVYMGRVTHYGRIQRFYRAGHLAHAPHGTDAQVMYAGSLLWLAVIGFALFAAAWSILRVNDHISSVKRRFTGPLRVSKKRAKAMEHRLRNLSKRAGRRKSFWNGQDAITQNLGEALTRALGENLKSLTAAEQLLDHQFRGLANEWQDLTRHLAEDVKSLNRAQKKRNRLPKDESTFTDDMRATKETFERLDRLFYELPQSKHSELAKNKSLIESDTRVSAGKDAVEVTLHEIKAWGQQLRPTDTIAAEVNRQEAAKSFFTRLEKDWVPLLEDKGALLEEIVSLVAHWREMHEKRIAERDRAEPKRLKKLKSIAKTTLFWMFGCWVAQV